MDLSKENLSKEIIIKHLKIFKTLQDERGDWETSWQLIAEYVYTKKADFTTQKEKGSFIDTHLFDYTAPQANKTRASVLQSLLWDNGAFKIEPDHKDINSDDEALKFLQNASEILRKEMNRGDGGLTRKLNSAEMNDGAFGNSCIFALEGGKIPLRFISVDVREMYFIEDNDGKVDTIYRAYKLDAKQMKEEFKEDKLADPVLSALKTNNYSKKFNILHIIEPRKIRNPNLRGILNAPFASIYIDKDNEKILKISGFWEQPFFVVRESKKTNEKYGRSSAMTAISDIAQVNKERKNYIIIQNKLANPPYGTFDDSVAGAQIINDSAGSVTVFKASGRMKGAPLFNMFEFNGDLQASMQSIQILQDNINKFFGLDRLLDFNNQTQMTATEVIQRSQIRQQSLGSLLDIKVEERYIPLIRRCFNILLRKGKFGVNQESNEALLAGRMGLDIDIIPTSIQKLIDSGDDFFKITFFTPFAREKENVKALSYLNLWNAAGQIAQLSGNFKVFDNLDEDKTIRLMSSISFSNDILRDEDSVEAIRQKREQEIQAQDMLAGANELSNINKNNAQAQK